MRRLLAVFTALIATLALVVACSNPPKRGTVTYHWYRPAHTHTWYSTTCWSRDKNGFCTFSTTDEHDDYVPDRWQVQVTKDADDTSDADKTGWWDVDALGYQLCPVKARWPDCNER